MQSRFDGRVVVGAWHELGADASELRHEVFVVEQRVPGELELDDQDAVSWHAVAYGPDGDALGTGRLLPDSHIGRMAVRRAARGLGVGGAVLQALMQQARHEVRGMVTLNAQTHAQGFYERHGFVAEGETFMDAGIAHIKMTRPATGADGGMKIPSKKIAK